MILLDTSGLVAALVPDQRDHVACASVLRRAEQPGVLSPFVLAEVDYLMGRFAGVDAQLSLYGEVSRGAYRLAPFSAPDVAHAGRVVGRFRDLRVGLADASLVVLAEREGIGEVLTLDERHFRTLPGPAGRPFRLLPSDA
ncbi:hypothetical protein BH24ACT14_BH24ACT14_08290 [soil metagenome]